MDAVKFIEERNRMCDFYKGKCTGCPLVGKPCNGFRNLDVENTVAEVEAWSAAHPRKTRQSVFLEQYPEARLDGRDVLRICPAEAYGNKVCPKNGENVRMLCCNCRREFWMQEV